MSILAKHQIIEYLEKGELIINAHKLKDGVFDVEPASYDLRAGTIIWKETDIKSGKSEAKSKFYNPSLPFIKQENVTLQPGQVMFVITYEEILMPIHLCGTVYAKNKFSRDGIFALTTGHVDPGIQCPIVIRLINLRSIPYTFVLGEPIYTIVFHNLDLKEVKLLEKHVAISMEQTFSRTIESANAALGNALNDLSLTSNFVRKDEFGKIFVRQFIKTFWGWVLIIFALLAGFASILKIIEFYRPKP
jgi:deoxycytidine triphosphate deaminase